MNVVFYKSGDMIIPLKPDTYIQVDTFNKVLNIDGYLLYAGNFENLLFLLEEFLYILDEVYKYRNRVSLNKKEVDYFEIIDFMKKIHSEQGVNNENE